MDQQPTPTEAAAQTPRESSRNPFFSLVLFSSTIFIITILAMVAVIFSDPDAPIVQFLDRHGGRLILAEVVVTLIVGLLALIVDRFQTPQKKPSESQKDSAEHP